MTPRASWTRSWAGIAILAGGCAAPYQAGRVRIPDVLASDLETRIQEVFIRHFPRLLEVEHRPLRMRSAWMDGMDGVTPVQAQGFLAVDPDPAPGRAGVIEVVVRRRALRQSLLTGPEWIDIGGDIRLENQITAELEAALGLKS